MRAGRDRGHEHRAAACDVEARQRAVVRELRGDAWRRARGPGRRAPADPGSWASSDAPDLTLVDAAVGIRDRDRADQQQRRAAARPGLEVRELGVGDRAVGDSPASRPSAP